MKEIVVEYRNVNNGQKNYIRLPLPDNSGEILSIERVVDNSLHSRYGRIQD